MVPAGVFVSGLIFLTQGVSLEVAEGGALQGSQDTNDYPWIKTRIAGLEMKSAALVNAQSVSNLSITGKGVIDGSGLRWWREYWAARAEEPDGMDPHFKVGRPRLIHIMGATNVTVAGLTLRNSAFWTLQLTYCEGVLVSNITVRNPHAPVRAASFWGNPSITQTAVFQPQAPATAIYCRRHPLIAFKTLRVGANAAIDTRN